MSGQPQQGQTAKSKFEGALLHWTAKKLPDGWETQVVDALADVVVGDDIVVTRYGDKVEIGVFHKTINLAQNRSGGSITPGDGDWKMALILLRLAKYLPVVMVDDSSNPVDRRILKSLFTGRGYLFMSQGSSLDEFDDFATTVGLIPKLSSSINQAASHFF